MPERQRTEIRLRGASGFGDFTDPAVISWMVSFQKGALCAHGYQPKSNCAGGNRNTFHGGNGARSSFNDASGRTGAPEFLVEVFGVILAGYASASKTPRHLAVSDQARGSRALGCLAWLPGHRTLGCRRAAQVDPAADRNASHVQWRSPGAHHLKVGSHWSSR